jgi:hypothetical protein
MAANTNLERISDWLTTLLVGATLVQLKDITEWIGKLGDSLVVDGTIPNQAVVPVIIIYFFSLAFLGVYLITRLYLTSAFVNTLGMLTGQVERRNLESLKTYMTAALGSNDGASLRSFLAEYEKSEFAKLQPADPALNDLLARSLAQLIRTDNLGGRPGNAKEDLKKLIATAAKDASIKNQLKKDMDAGTLKTGDATLDADLLALLN